MKTQILSIDDINSTGIRIAARKDGITSIERLGDNRKHGDAKVVIYRLGVVRVAETNGDPVWEESDPTGFAELLESEGIAI